MRYRLLHTVLSGCLLAALLAPARADEPDDAYERHMDAGRTAFYEAKDFEAARGHYERAAAVEGLDRTRRATAEFWTWAAASRGEVGETEVALGYRWLARWPKSAHRAYVRYFLGLQLQQLGRHAEARHAWETLVEADPDSPLAAQARALLDGNDKPPAPAAEPIAPVAAVSVPVPATDPHVGPAVVVSMRPTAPAPDAEAFAGVAREIAKWHDATLLTAARGDVPALVAKLRDLRPRQVLVVLLPTDLDLALHRTLLLAAARHDADPFVDHTLGYFTARTPKTLKAMWARTKALHASGLAGARWLGTSITSGASALKTPRVPAIAEAAGFEGGHLYFAMPAKAENAEAFLASEWRRLEQANVITMTGCGDPESIWLFDDARNADRSKHWPFDPAKVGSDPDGGMPRIRADAFRSLTLSSPIVWSGTCHSGATGPVFVEGDIVSTFGRTEHVTRYEMPAKRSLALALLDAGATAFLCPLGANHGMSVSREVEFALAEGASLGEVLKSTYDDIALAAGERLRLTIPVPGAEHARVEPIMQGGGANRILIGDPALRPFERTPHPAETVEVTPVDGGLDVAVHWKAGFHPGGWDMFGTDRARDWQLPVRIPLDDWPRAAEASTIRVTLEAVDAEGKALPYGIARAVVEQLHGRRFLHLKATAPRADVQRAAVRATFTLRLAPAETGR